MPTMGQLESFASSARLLAFDLVDPLALAFGFARDAFFFAFRFEAMAAFYVNCVA